MLEPIAKIKVFPQYGDSTLLFELNASGTIDKQFYQASLVFRWSFSNKKEWDTEFSHDPIIVRYFSFPGSYLIKVEAMNPDGQTSIASDTIIVYGSNKEIATVTDWRDSQNYKVVRLNGQWWMAESLRFGEIISPYSQDYTDNQITERLVIEDCISHQTYSVYSWFEAMNYKKSYNQGICPTGWHIPTLKEWNELYIKYPIEFVAKYLGPEGLSGLNLQNGLSSVVDPINNYIYCNKGYVSYWASDNFTNTAELFFASHLNFSKNSIVGSYIDQTQLKHNDQKMLVNTVRCLKDQH